MAKRRSVRHHEKRTGMVEIIGIDLGTSHTASAIFEEGAPRLLLNQEGGRTTPNVVALGPDGEWLVGQAARRTALLSSKNAFRDFLRLLGRPSDSPEVRNASTYAPFRLVEGPEGHVHIETDRGDYHPAALVALVLAKQKTVAEAKLQTSVDQAVIALPPPTIRTKSA